VEVLSLIDVWIKAAVEHKTLEITYHSGRTKGETTTREVEPDYYGWSIDHKNFGLWAVCKMRRDVRCFKEDSVLSWKYTGNSFTPNPRGRWQELISIYNSKGLASKQF
jgi:predicted DNA-binding transcriptional regulator YafY